jgi:hypothetical protein
MEACCRIQVEGVKDFALGRLSPRTIALTGPRITGRAKTDCLCHNILDGPFEN